MGLFSSKKPEPVRKDVVLELTKLGMRRTDAEDRDGRMSAADEAKHDSALRRATAAEKAASYEALKRHGY